MSDLLALAARVEAWWTQRRCKHDGVYSAWGLSPEGERFLIGEQCLDCGRVLCGNPHGPYAALRARAAMENDNG